jgi:Flp pilus assembly protein TadG
MKINTQSNHKERGQSMVELALTMTILMVLLAGTIDLGRAFFTWLTMRDAAQDGASYGAMEPTQDAKIQDRIKYNIYDILRDPAADVLINVAFSSGQRCLGTNPTTITVSITYKNFPITMPLLGTVLGSQTIPIQATIKDTVIRPACK